MPTDPRGTPLESAGKQSGPCGTCKLTDVVQCSTPGKPAMRVLRLLLASSLLALSVLAGTASATSYSTDQSDLWFLPTESGWGIQLVQRGSTIFATMFVYDAAGKPIWYVATMSPIGDGITWTGDLFVASQGPWFGNPMFDPAAVIGRKVGTMTWFGQLVNSGVLEYTVDGVAVTKNPIRQPIANENYSGRFGFGRHSTSTGCSNTDDNGIRESVGVVTVGQTGNAVSLTVVNDDTCTYLGTLNQSGQMGNIAGNYSCTSGDMGSFSLFEVQVTLSAISGRFSADSTSGKCHTTGWFGGGRTTLF